MPKVTFLPMNVTVDAEPGQTILEVAQENDVDLPNSCGGNFACGMCMVIHKEGELSPKDEDTEGLFSPEEDHRLGCAARVMNNDIVVEIP